MSWTYDANGNRTKRGLSIVAEYDEQDPIKWQDLASFHHDARGSRTKRIVGSGAGFLGR